MCIITQSYNHNNLCGMKRMPSFPSIGNVSVYKTQMSNFAVFLACEIHSLPQNEVDYHFDAVSHWLSDCTTVSSKSQKYSYHLTTQIRMNCPAIQDMSQVKIWNQRL